MAAADPFAGVPDEQLPQTIDTEVGKVLDQMMTTENSDELPQHAAKIDALLASPTIANNPSLQAQVQHVKTNTHLHRHLRHILNEIKHTDWGTDGSALAALSQKAAALITPEIEQSHPQTAARMRAEIAAAIEAKRPASA